MTPQSFFNARIFIPILNLFILVFLWYKLKYHKKQKSLIEKKFEQRVLSVYGKPNFYLTEFRTQSNTLVYAFTTKPKS